jgi:hypothetical protein
MVQYLPVIASAIGLAIGTALLECSEQLFSDSSGR